jgi:Holliday junction resolvase RusA-like endonuclease
MTEHWYLCEVNPVPWQIGPVGAKRGQSGRIAGYVGRDQELHTYQQALKEELAKQSPVMLDGDVLITCFFWRSRVAGLDASTGKRQKKSQADCTNMLKSTEDACQGILFKNDKGNVAVRGFIVDQGSEVEGRVIIKVEAAGPDHKSEILNLLPDHLYVRVVASPDEQLMLAVNMPNTSLKADYGNDEEDLPF